MCPAEIRPLATQDETTEFDCGERSLNEWLAEHAWAAQAGRTARVFCAIARGRIVGHCALAAGSLFRGHAKPRLVAGAPDPIPVVVLGRLAVDHGWHGRGIGASLLVDALRRVAQAGDLVGARAIVVHALDSSAVYRPFGFVALPGHEHHLYLLVKDFARRFA